MEQYMKSIIKKVFWGVAIVIVILTCIYQTNKPVLTDKINGTYKCDSNDANYFSFNTYEDNTFYYTEQRTSEHYLEGYYIKGNFEILNETQTCVSITCAAAENRMIVPDQKICSDGLKLTIYIDGKMQNFTKIDEISTKFYYPYQ